MKNLIEMFRKRNKGKGKMQLSDYAVMAPSNDLIYYNYFIQFKPLTIIETNPMLSTSSKAVSERQLPLFSRMQAFTSTIKENFSIN
jgi:hypothetical protein